MADNMTWTSEQKQVIDLRDRSLLVSAAAGSGKTAVLVQRIIERICDESHPVDIDRLLVVTFTNAAAGEMRERVQAAIAKRVEENPDNTHLRRQEVLAGHAHITTIDSFCLSVLREHFQEIELDPGFRIADEGELKLLQADVLEALLEEEYEQASESFIHFIKENSQVLGTNCKEKDSPLLIKYIDSKKELSIQVHPNDAYARINEHDNGKTELWYIVESDSNAYIYLGLKQKLTKEEFHNAISENTITKYMNKLSVKKGDVFLVEPGTLHSIGEGCLIAEIQKNQM